MAKEIEFFDNSDVTSVEDYWNDHTVQDESFANAEESDAYLDWRASLYPLMTDLMKLYEPHKGEIVLDYGCGPGDDFIGYMRHSEADCVIGMDVSLKALGLLSRRIDLYNFERNYRLIKISDSIPTIPLDDGSVDHIHSSGVVQHTSSPEIILKEFHRVLASGGTATIMVYNRDSIWFHLFAIYERMIRKGHFEGLSAEEAFARTTDGEDCPQSRCYTFDSFSAICAEAGFSVKYMGGYMSLRDIDICTRLYDKALQDDRIPEDTREFLTGLTFDINDYPAKRTDDWYGREVSWGLDKGDKGYPKSRGYYAGIGGVYHIRKNG